MFPTEEISRRHLIHRLETAGMTNEERALCSLTRRNLKTLPNWPEWEQCHDAQLDNHHSAGVFGEPIPCPAGS
jgi:hypothetical protein